MMTLGIDVGKSRHNAALLDEGGKKVFQNLFFTNNHEGVAKLMEQVDAANLSPKGIRVGMEATGHYWINLYATLKEAGFSSVEVINPIIIHARKNENVRGVKTDRVDALRIARYLSETDRKISAIPDEETEQLRKLARSRYELSQMATGEKNRLISLLDLSFPEYRDQFSDLFGTTSLEVLAEYPTAEELAKVDIDRLTELLKKASRGRLGREKADRLQQAARTSFASENLSMEIRFVVERLNLLIDQIDRMDRQLQEFFPELQILLRTVPGIGPVWAPLILGEVRPVFHPEEKNGANSLVAFAGLDAIICMSGRDYDKDKQKAHMSKRGSKYLRTAIMQASVVAANKDPMFQDIYQRQRAMNKSHLVAVSHVGRKMLHVIFSVLKHNKPYQPVINEKQA